MIGSLLSTIVAGALAVSIIYPGKPAGLLWPLHRPLPYDVRLEAKDIGMAPRKMMAAEKTIASAESENQEENAKHDAGIGSDADPLGPAERHQVIEALSESLTQHYSLPHVGQKIAFALHAHEVAGDYDSVANRQDFGNLLTHNLQELSHDRSLIVLYSKGPLPIGTADFHRLSDHFRIALP